MSPVVLGGTQTTQRRRVSHGRLRTRARIHSLVRAADSISLCLSKGLGAPVGSVIVGTRDFVERARRYRKGIPSP